jgi:hypothetical protein
MHLERVHDSLKKRKRQKKTKTVKEKRESKQRKSQPHCFPPATKKQISNKQKQY